MVASFRVLLNNYRYGNPAHHRINIFLLAYFLTKACSFCDLCLFQNDLAPFTEMIALSATINGGLCKLRPGDQARPGVSAFLSACPNRLTSTRRRHYPLLPLRPPIESAHPLRYTHGRHNDRSARHFHRYTAFVAANGCPYASLREVADQAVSMNIIVQDAGSTDGDLGLWLPQDHACLGAISKRSGHMRRHQPWLSASRPALLAHLNYDRNTSGALAGVVEFFAQHPDVDILVWRCRRGGMPLANTFCERRGLTPP